nr:SGNH/GDSL hydrolase family protein [Ruminococcus sp.]
MRSKHFFSDKKKIKRLAGIAGAILLCYMISEALNYMYVEEADWGRILWHHFYEDSGRIENLYLGSSHVYCDIDPQLLDGMNGKYNFNLASGNQTLNGSYYLLKEADRKNDLSHVYLELSYMCSTKNNFDSDIDPADIGYYENWRNFDYMENSLNKAAYFFSFTGTEKYIDTLLPFSRYRSNLDNWDYIKQTMEKKKGSDYLNYVFRFDYDDGNGYNEYQRQGYWYTTRAFAREKRVYGQMRILGEDPLGESSEKYLRKIISYCQKQNIPITLFCSPVDELMLVSTGNYDNYVTQIREIAEEYGVPFYDFNLARRQYLPIREESCFFDIDHLNHTGAEIFTAFFSDVVSGDAAGNEKYFYKSYAEKLQAEEPSLYGLYYRNAEGSEEYPEQNLLFSIASNREEGMEYKVLLTPEAGEERLVQDFSENKEFRLSALEHGICTVIARMADDPENVQTLEVSY